MTRTQSYIIVGLAISVVVICALAVILIWLRFSPDASLVSVPTFMVTYTPPPTATLTATLLPTSTPPPTSTATRVVSTSSGFTDAEREYLSDVSFNLTIMSGAILTIDNLVSKAEMSPSIIYDQDWQTDLLIAGTGIYVSGESIVLLSPPLSMYAFHQDLLEWVVHMMNAGTAINSFVDTDNPAFIDTAANEFLAAGSFQDHMQSYPNILDFLDQQNTTFMPVETPIPEPTPTKTKCKVIVGDTYILVDCDQLD